MTRLIAIILLVLGMATRCIAHPMPNSVLLLNVKHNGVAAELQWPLKEFQLAFPEEDITGDAKGLIAQKSQWLDQYLLSHISITTPDGKPWQITITDKSIAESKQDATGVFQELIFTLWMQPPAGASPRHFSMQYDAIMHQVVTHKLMIRIAQDWDGGLSAHDSADADLGVLYPNPADGKVEPLIVNLDDGSKWKGFTAMVKLGMEHISEGTDHLLFLLVLMLPAPLLVRNRKWVQSGGARYSLMMLLKIATAFTIGHSLTLIVGALGWVHFPAQPIEVLIALSITIGAVHALKPLFPGKEMFVAGGFGLIHGLAFASVLSNLQLDTSRMVLSILGFNIGIELMQLFIVIIFVPWLIIISEYKVYTVLRIAGGIFAMIASIAWIAQRISGKDNWVTNMLVNAGSYAKWVIVLLIVIAMLCRFAKLPKYKDPNATIE